MVKGLFKSIIIRWGPICKIRFRILPATYFGYDVSAPNMTGIDELHFTGKAQRCMLVQQPLWQVREMGCLAVLLQALCTAVPQLPEFCRQLLAVVLSTSTDRIAIIIATNRVREKNNAWSNAAQYWRDYLDKRKIIFWFTNITFTHLAVFTIYTGCFTTLGHNCRRWFPRSLWWKKFI